MISVSSHDPELQTPRYNSLVSNSEDTSRTHWIPGCLLPLFPSSSLVEVPFLELHTWSLSPSQRCPYFSLFHTPHFNLPPSRSAAPAENIPHLTSRQLHSCQLDPSHSCHASRYYCKIGLPAAVLAPPPCLFSMGHSSQKASVTCPACIKQTHKTNKQTLKTNYQKHPETTGLANSNLLFITILQFAPRSAP